MLYVMASIGSVFIVLTIVANVFALDYCDTPVRQSVALPDNGSRWTLIATTDGCDSSMSLDINLASDSFDESQNILSISGSFLEHSVRWTAPSQAEIRVRGNFDRRSGHVSGDTYYEDRVLVRVTTNDTSDDA